MRADILQMLATRTPEAKRRQFAQPVDVIAWIAQSWAYDRHNVGDTLVDGKPIYGGDAVRTLRSVKAKALLMSGELDLYNPDGTPCDDSERSGPRRRFAGFQSGGSRIH